MGVGTVDRKARRHGGRLGDALLEASAIESSTLAKALETQRGFGGRLGTNLLETGRLAELDLLAALGRINSTQTADAESLRAVPAEIIRMVPPKLARRFEVVPYRLSGGSLLVAGLDPGDAVAEDELSGVTGALVRTVIGLEVRVREALARYYRIPLPVRLEALARRLDGRTTARESEAMIDAPTAGAATPTLVPASLRASASAPEGAVERRRPRQVKARTEEPREIELTDAERLQIFGVDEEAETETSIAPAAGRAESTVAREAAEAPESNGSVEARLDSAGRALAQAEIRDEVADALLAFVAPDFARRLLLIRRGSQILGWRGDGEGLTPKAVRRLEIDAESPSLFANLTEHPQTWLGPLPPFPAHGTLLDILGGGSPSCVALPLSVRGRVIAFIYLDQGPSATGTEATPPEQLRNLERVASMAGLAFEVALLRNKIRTL